MYRFPFPADIFAPSPPRSTRATSRASAARSSSARRAHRAEPAPHAREGARAVSARALPPCYADSPFAQLGLLRQGRAHPLSMFHCALRISGIKDVELKEDDAHMYTIKFSRQNGIHVSPTALWDGLVANEISSSWGEQEWMDFLLAKVTVE
ncbi:hypothetical protein B0H14DRAFT_3873624 [Mycena olivaceomarginata]|nr:hypothetical protein B0H14DRAFT_3873624 [Mycena olivaceomarginata]